MACSGAWSGGTAFVTFDDVKVPVGNLIGEENKGFKYHYWCGAVHVLDSRRLTLQIYYAQL